MRFLLVKITINFLLIGISASKNEWTVNRLSLLFSKARGLAVALRTFLINRKTFNLAALRWASVNGLRLVLFNLLSSYKSIPRMPAETDNSGQWTWNGLQHLYNLYSIFIITFKNETTKLVSNCRNCSRYDTYILLLQNTTLGSYMIIIK